MLSLSEATGLNKFNQRAGKDWLGEIDMQEEVTRVREEEGSRRVLHEW